MKNNSNFMSKTVILDLDGVIVDFRNCTENCDYSQYPKNHKQLKRMKCPISPYCVASIKELQKLGLYIIIYTGRTEDEREVTEKWLDLHSIPYNKLIMGKPRGFIYVDDLSYQFNDWKSTLSEIYKRLTLVP